MFKNNPMNAIPALLIASLLFGLASMARAQTIYFGTSADHAPYDFLDRHGRVQGFEAELQDLLCTRANMDCAWVLAPREELAQQLVQGEFDVIMSAYQITDNRKTYTLFSEPYSLDMPSAVLVNTGASAPFNGANVGAIDGSLQGDIVTRKGWTLRQFTRASGALAALEDGEISAFITDQAYAKHIADQHPDRFDIAALGLATPGGIGLGLRGSDGGLLARFNAALATLRNDGTLNTLTAKWFGPNSQSAQNN